MNLATRVTILLVIAVVAAGGLLLDASAGPSTPAAEPSPTPVALEPPDRGSLYCVPLTDEGESARVTVAAAEEPTQVEVAAAGAVVERVAVAPSEPLVVELTEGDAAAPVTIRWDGAPAVATYETVGEGPQVVQSCATTTEPRWHVAGYTTTLGNQASLHLYNPFSVDAVARVSFATPAGAVDLVTTQDLAVPAGEAVAVDIDDVQPEVADLGVIVDVLTGRLVAAGQMRFGPPDDDTRAPTGRTALAAVGEPTLTHSFPYGSAVEDGASTWVSLVNPSPDTDALVTVRVSAPDPEAQAPGETTVPAGGTARVQLDGLSERATFASTVQVVNEVPIVASRLTTRDTEGGEDAEAASAVDAGTPGSGATQWLVLGGTEGRTSVVDVYNVSGGEATVAVEPLLPDGGTVPDDWAATIIEPNGQRGFPLADLGVAEGVVPVRVRSDQPVVVGIRRADASGSAAGFSTLLGFTPDLWAGLQQRPSLQLAPELGRAPLPTASPSVTPDPTATPTATPSPTSSAVQSSTPFPSSSAAPAAAPTAPTPAPRTLPTPGPTGGSSAAGTAGS